MSLLTYNSLVQLVDTGIIDAKHENINGASIDITLGPIISVECKDTFVKPIKIYEKQSPVLVDIDATKPVVIEPGEFFLATTVETFNLPPHIACEYKLTSSMGRCGLQHMLAGWGDPGWHNSHMTLEFCLALRYQAVEIKAGMIIGQIVFWEGEAVPEDKDYAARGRYNNQGHVPTRSKGVGK